MGMLVWTARIRAARAALRMGQRELAAAAGIARSALVTIEASRGGYVASLYECQKALEAEGIEFWEVGGNSGIFFPTDEPAPFAAFCRAARAVLMATRESMSAVAQLAPQTINVLEDGQGSERSIRAFLKCVEAVGISYADLETRQGLILPTTAALRELLSKDSSS